MLAVQAAFDWASLDPEARAFVLEKTEAIKARMKRTAEDVIAIGQDLLAVKERLAHGQFLGWITSEFGMAERSAQNFMQVARRFGDKSAIIADLAPTILYELAAPSTHDDVIERVTSGQLPATLPAIREAKAALLQMAGVQWHPPA